MLIPNLYPLPGGITAAQILALSPAAWYRWNTGITESGGLVSAWADQIASHPLTQGTGVNQPALTASNTVLYDGSNSFMKSTSVTAGQPCTRVLLFRQITWAANAAIAANAGGLTNPRIDQITASPNIALFAGAASSPSTNPDLALNTWGVITTVFNGASSTVRINDGADVTGNPGANGFSGGVTQGGRTSSTNLSNVEIAEDIVFPSGLSDSEKALVYKWMQQEAALFGASV